LRKRVAELKRDVNDMCNKREEFLTEAHWHVVKENERLTKENETLKATNEMQMSKHKLLLCKVEGVCHTLEDRANTLRMYCEESTNMTGDQ